MPTVPRSGDVRPEPREQCPATTVIAGVKIQCEGLKGHSLGPHYVWVKKGDKSTEVTWGGFE